MLKNFFTFSRFTLFVALCISAIAAWYSVIGLTAIFAGAVIPIIVMGSILEVAKITTTVWLHRYWDRAGYAIRTYLTVAVVALACLTSMGIFGLLSKAHLEQNVVSGDVGAQVALLDEKIKTQRDNIDLARKALAQMDSQVDQRLARGDTESGAERAVQIRRQQAKERAALQVEIVNAQKEISKLNEQRAPIATQLRKVEAEVGPVKYIAALIYGDNPDITTLERAVRWVIILIVIVFDPLAIVLILAANNSLKWEREIPTPRQEVEEEQPEEKTETTENNEVEDTPLKEEPLPEETTTEVVADQTPLDGEQIIQDSTINTDNKELQEIPEVVEEKNEIEKIEETIEEESPQANVESAGVQDTMGAGSGDKIAEQVKDIVTEGITSKAEIYSTDDDYVIYQDKKISTEALKQLKPGLVVDGPIKNDILFGNKFPNVSKTGDIYTRVDVLPHRTYKFNGVRWMQVDRAENTSYLQNVAYLQYLISKLDSAEYDPEMLTDVEQDEISEYLKRTQ